MEILYYYTTAETMKYILTGGDIFATHIRYLNDSEEYVNGLRELRAVLKNEELCGAEVENFLNSDAYSKALKEIPEIYSISFSKEADLLSQWYMYAKESGVRLGMAFPKGMQSFNIKKKKTGKLSGKTQEAMLRDVYYFTRTGMPFAEYQEEQRRIIKAMQDYAKEQGVWDDFETNAIRLWKDMAPYQIDQDRVEQYCREIKKNVTDGAGIFTYRDQIYDVLGNQTGRERDYLDRNYYSNCGIIVRKSNAPYVFS